MTMRTERFTVWQRVILFAIYFCVYARVISPLYYWMVATVSPDSNLMQHGTMYLWFFVGVGLSVASVALTDKFATGIFRHAIRKL